MKGKVRIDVALCKGCGYCVLTCPKGVLAMKKGARNGMREAAAVADSAKCTGCALCAQFCPEIAIEVWRGK